MKDAIATAPQAQAEEEEEVMVLPGPDGIANGKPHAPRVIPMDPSLEEC